MGWQAGGECRSGDIATFSYYTRQSIYLCQRIEAWVHDIKVDPFPASGAPLSSGGAKDNSPRRKPSGSVGGEDKPRNGAEEAFANSLPPRSGAGSEQPDSTRLAPWAIVFRPSGWCRRLAYLYAQIPADFLGVQDATIFMSRTLEACPAGRVRRPQPHRARKRLAPGGHAAPSRFHAAGFSERHCGAG